MHQRGLFCKSARGAFTCLQHSSALWQGLGLEQRMQCLLRKHCMYKRPGEGNASAHPTAPQTRRTPHTGTWPPRGGGWPPRPLAETPAAPLPSPAPHAHDITHTLSSSCAGGARTAASRTNGGWWVGKEYVQHAVRATCWLLVRQLRKGSGAAFTWPLRGPYTSSCRSSVAPLAPAPRCPVRFTRASTCTVLYRHITRRIARHVHAQGKVADALCVMWLLPSS